jgi:hypothetical protein
MVVLYNVWKPFYHNNGCIEFKAGDNNDDDADNDILQLIH